MGSEKGAWELGREVSEMARLLGRERAGEGEKGKGKRIQERAFPPVGRAS